MVLKIMTYLHTILWPLLRIVLTNHRNTCEHRILYIIRAHLRHIMNKSKAHHFLIGQLAALDGAILSHSLLMFFPFNVAKEIHLGRDLKEQNQSNKINKMLYLILSIKHSIQYTIYKVRSL
jgi:hypothetical protein